MTVKKLPARALGLLAGLAMALSTVTTIPVSTAEAAAPAGERTTTVAATKVTYVSKSKPKTAYPKKSTARASKSAYSGYVQFPAIKLEPGESIVSATLQVHVKSLTGKKRAKIVATPVEKGWSATKLTYKKRPDLLTGKPKASKTAKAKKTVKLSLDVDKLDKQLRSGAAFRLTNKLGGSSIKISATGSKAPRLIVKIQKSGSAAKAPAPKPTTPKPTPKPTTPAPKPSTPTTAPAATTGGYTLSDGCKLNARGIGKCAPLVGAAHGSNTDPASLEKSLGQRLGVRRTYWRSDQVDSAIRLAKADVSAGRIPWMSFKLPKIGTWKEIANGKGDAWAKDLAAKIKTVNGPVWVAFHHEPEGDGNIADWKAMQERLGPILRNGAPNAGFSVILMGYHEWYGESKYRIENIWPNTTVDIAGFDVYCFYGTAKHGTSVDPSLKPRYFSKISAWAKSKGVAWGLAETGLTDAAFKDNPKWITTTYQELKSTGALAMSYFDTALNSTDTYRLTGGAKNKNYAEALKTSPQFPKR
ncbi:MAG: DNRLRE domain-containing protein [Actinobacteria bacterium]|nr:DNRLRE domain-containing protein [Actinomycetota bacterium]